MNKSTGLWCQKETLPSAWAGQTPSQNSEVGTCLIQDVLLQFMELLIVHFGLVDISTIYIFGVLQDSYLWLTTHSRFPSN